MELLNNKIIIAAAIAWACSQVSKTIIHAIINRKIDWSRLRGDGGMPSSHSATVTAAAAASAVVCGLGSPVFAVMLLFALITCHDAMNSRREIGKHSLVLNELILQVGHEEPLDVVLKEFVGHTPLQVLAGIIFGLIVAYFVCR